MPNHRKTSPRLAQMLELFSRNEDWVIVINADPDALASALALKRIMARRVGKVIIAHINEISRPDNLAMIRYLRIPLTPWSESLLERYHRFAVVDSQPHHNAAFAGIPFSIVIDHHPLVPEHPVEAEFVDILPQYGAVSSRMTEYLRALRMRPGIRLATALQYGIRTDTATFTRKSSDADMRAFQQLSSHADNALLTRIVRSEYLPEWLKYFGRAIVSLHRCRSGMYSFLGEVDNPDILVVVADFFTRVHGLRWIAICGVYRETVVVIFRGDGQSIDVGAYAAQRLDALGSAGGHRAMARAEFPLSAAEGRNVEVFVYRRLADRLPKTRKDAPVGQPSAAEENPALPAVDATSVPERTDSEGTTDSGTPADNDLPGMQTLGG